MTFMMIAGKIFRMISACALALFLIPLSSVADILIKLEIEHLSLVEGEPVNILVTFYNEGERDVIIDSENGGNADFYFDIQRINGSSGRRISKKTLVERMKLKPDEQYSVLVDAGDYYDLLGEGRYIIAGVISVDGKQYRSERKVIEVVSGIELVRQNRTVMRNGIDHVRSYSLRYWAREKKEWLFLVVEDDEGEASFGAFLLGPVIRYFKPELKTDREGNIVTYHQSGPNRFTRTVFQSTPYEITFLDQNYFDEEGNLLKRVSAASEEDETSRMPPEANLPKRESKTRKKGGLLNWLFR